MSRYGTKQLKRILKKINSMSVEDYKKLYDECKGRGNGEKVFIPCCDDIVPMTQRINNVIATESARKGGINILGKDYKYFKYCPWCGEKIK